ncbi:MAG: tRNA pseudouridine(38-40) synthase TruA [Thermoguttaceae bacterium]|jgi:tRNA pseudouridine38-40 synthase
MTDLPQPCASCPAKRRTLKLEICFDGLPFSGWQAQPSQPNVRTVQGEIEHAVRQVTGESVTLLGCGRTDAGVSALRQVASFRSDTPIPSDKLLRALNANLPPEIRLLAISDVPDSFHPIADVVRKRYRYLLSDSRPLCPFLKDRVWFTRRKFDLLPMQEAARVLLGTHDFASFQTTGSPRESTVRTVYAIDFTQYAVPEFWAQRRTDDLTQTEILSIEIEADGFLYNMARAIVGTLRLFGERHAGFENPATMKKILESKDRANAGPTAPAHALYMLEAVYESAD